MLPVGNASVLGESGVCDALAVMLRSNAAALPLENWEGRSCDLYPVIVMFREESIEEYSHFLSLPPRYRAHIWDSPDQRLGPLERYLASRSDVLIECPQASAIAALRRAGRVLVQARMDRGSQDPSDGKVTLPSEPFPELVRDACCWREAHLAVRSKLDRAGVDVGSWPFALAEAHLRTSFQSLGLNEQRCGDMTKAASRRPWDLSSASPWGLLAAAGKAWPDLSLEQLVEAVTLRVQIMPPILAMVGDPSADCISAGELQRRLPADFREAVVSGVAARVGRHLAGSVEQETKLAALRSIARKFPSVGISGAASLDATRIVSEGHVPQMHPSIVETYMARARRSPPSGHVCEQLQAGMWYVGTPAVSRCKHLAAARLLGFAPGDVVLDWGAGCGHGLAWIAAEFRTLGIAVDLLPSNLEWAMEYTPIIAAMSGGDYMRVLADIPDGSMDHVISNGVVANLLLAHQCRFVREQVFRVLRPGGTAWLGFLGISWNGLASCSTRMFWRRCIRAHRGFATFAIFDEVDVFGTSEHEVYSQNANDSVSSKGAFSLFLVKAR